MIKPKNIINKQKFAYNYLFDQAGTLGYIMKLSSLLLGILYLGLGIVMVIIGGEIAIIVSLILFFLTYIFFRRYWRTRCFNRNDVFNGREYIKSYEKQFKKGSK